MACHVCIDDIPPSESNCILLKINAVAREHFHIHHTTVQFEHRDCEVLDGCVVPMSSELVAEADHGHDHHGHHHHSRALALTAGRFPRDRRATLTSILGGFDTLLRKPAFSPSCLLTRSICRSTRKCARSGSWSRPRSTPSPANTRSAVDPDTPLSFYAKDGKLYVESERMVPAALTEAQPAEFRLVQHALFQFAVTAVTLSQQGEPPVQLQRTGDAVHHLFHTYERREAMIPARDGVKLSRRDS